MRKKGISEVVVRSVKSLYKGAKTRVRVDSVLSEEFEVKVGMHQGSVLSPFLFVVVVDVVTELATVGVLSEWLYADDLVLMSETIVRHEKEFTKWREAFESTGLIKSHSDGKWQHHKGWLVSKSKVGPCCVCSLRVKANPLFCMQCGK